MLAALVIAVITGSLVAVARTVSTSDPRLWSITDMPEAVVGRVVGVVRAVEADVLEAPVSARPCLFYAVHVTDAERTLAHDQRGLVFEIDDGTGIARIDATDATSMLSPTKFHNTVLTAPTERQVALLERNGYQGTFLNVHYKEAIVQIGDRIAVTGIGRRLNGTLTLRSDFGRKPALANDRRATRIRLPSARL